MRRSVIALVVTLAVGMWSLIAQAQAPAKPRALTAAQFNELQRMESNPGNATVLAMHASYKSEKEKHLELNRISDDTLTVVYEAGFPALILTLLICAAPL